LMQALVLLHVQPKLAYLLKIHRLEILLFGQDMFHLTK
jgi:hypothetical protein